VGKKRRLGRMKPSTNDTLRKRGRERERKREGGREAMGGGGGEEVEQRDQIGRNFAIGKRFPNLLKSGQTFYNCLSNLYFLSIIVNNLFPSTSGQYVHDFRNILVAFLKYVYIITLRD
jgi:hypothetical protein